MPFHPKNIIQRKYSSFFEWSLHPFNIFCNVFFPFCCHFFLQLAYPFDINNVMVFKNPPFDVLKNHVLPKRFQSYLLLMRFFFVLFVVIVAAHTARILFIEWRIPGISSAVSVQPSRTKIEWTVPTAEHKERRFITIFLHLTNMNSICLLIVVTTVVVTPLIWSIYKKYTEKHVFPNFLTLLDYLF